MVMLNSVEFRVLFIGLVILKFKETMSASGRSGGSGSTTPIDLEFEGSPDFIRQLESAQKVSERRHDVSLITIVD